MEVAADYEMSAGRRERSCRSEHHTMEQQNYSVVVAAGCRLLASEIENQLF